MTARDLDPIRMDPARERQVLAAYVRHYDDGRGVCGGCHERWPCQWHDALWFALVVAGLPLPDVPGLPGVRLRGESTIQPKG